MEGDCSSSSSSYNNKSMLKNKDLVDLVFSWSIQDILNEELFKHQVSRIPDTFQSVEHYYGSFLYPLLEETRAELSSSLEAISDAPFASVIFLDQSKAYPTFICDLKVDCWRNRSGFHGKEPYRALPGDVFLFTEAAPKSVSDLQNGGMQWSLGFLTEILEDEEGCKISSADIFKVRLPNAFLVEGGMTYSVMFFLMNITTNERTWRALHSFKNLEIIKNLLCTNLAVDETCNICSAEGNGIWKDKFGLSAKLDESQYAAVFCSNCKLLCNHKSYVELIWGGPGTGKTRTLSMLLLTLLDSKCRTLFCSQNNVGVTEMATCVLRLVRESFQTGCGKDTSFFASGDILLFGEKGESENCSEVKDIYLDYRVEKLAEGLGPVSGWKQCFTSMIGFLEDCASHYHMCNDNQFTAGKMEQKSFILFAREGFRYVALPLRSCVHIICTHVPKSFIQDENFHNFVSLCTTLDSFEDLLFGTNVAFDEPTEHLIPLHVTEDSLETFVDTAKLWCLRSELLHVLRTLSISLNELNLPCTVDRGSIQLFCFQKASLIFCTASGSYKLHSLLINPLKVLVIDQAAELKESEVLIPLQLEGLRHIILAGDECQLQQMVKNNVSEEFGFGRSLFERLSVIGYRKHVLGVQYRMNPSISFFPNSKFYQNQIMDSSTVKCRSYRRSYLAGKMFGPYSFINVSEGKDVVDVGHSQKNMVEVVVVLKIVQMLHKACTAKKQPVSIGIVAPYPDQVAAIQQKLGQKYKSHGTFNVKVKSIDGWEGDEEIIILSTVRSIGGGSLGFFSSRRRTNFALTRARHCLWILGNEKTMSRSGSVWEELIHDAKIRQCFFNADDDSNLKEVILEVKKELYELDDLLNGDSMLFKSAKWKVVFSDNFTKSFGKLKLLETKKLVGLHLTKLASGWRPTRSNQNNIIESSSQILKKFKVGDLYIVCSIDIVKEFRYVQVLKIWDILPLADIPNLVKRLEALFAMYTEEYLHRCRAKCTEGDLEIPMHWESSSDIVESKDRGIREASNVGPFHGKYNVEHSKVCDSLLLMKFYSLSSGVVSHLLSGCDGKELGLHFELTEQENEIVFFKKSTFILGRSGTGKTTVLTTKLFRNEQIHHIASEGFHDVKRNMADDSRLIDEVSETEKETKEAVLHQIFVTVSPRLCQAVKQHVTHLKSFACGGNSSAQRSLKCMDEVDEMSQFADIPDSFIDLPQNLYPLFMTFHKFLMMLDGTVGRSFFNRFPDARPLCHGEGINSRSVALETLVRRKEVNYDRFYLSYWPHFDTCLTKQLSCTTVFTEIMSVIKGGLRVVESGKGILSQEEYVLLSEGQGSSFSRDKREIIYAIFLKYEKRKMLNGEFDLADLVIDLHVRLREEKYQGDSIDFVYIDEVQDLSTMQIALFKYICMNTEEGFLFSGDTAQTIAKGVHFRFEDIRCLFYTEFVQGSRNIDVLGRKEKGLISDIFHLSQNFRTHSGIIMLAQSVVDLLYNFFPSSIDVLSPESSLLCGEAPILLETENSRNAVLTIFENSGNDGSKIIMFGSEQVILVRDECQKREIFDYIGNKALVLTIMECKGLEFQDVLLYNFFSSSPLRNQWRVIYEYMSRRDLYSGKGTTFDQDKHCTLCSELKQLYVAITRTKQRLWFCEDEMELSEPMFSYWKKLCLVQVRQLDSSFAEEMQISSSQEDWRSRGIKLFYERNYETAMICFGRAGDNYWKKWAEAAKDLTFADHISYTDPEMSCDYRRKAANTFYSIGKAEYAAQCFFELKEYARAGRIYREKCGDLKLEKAGECFYLAGCFDLAAEVYSIAKIYSKCLAVCTDQKLFDLGLQYIQCWKQDEDKKLDMDKMHDFLERGAYHYFDLKNNNSMMKFVKSFSSKNSMRTFLKKFKCLDELILLEQEWGNLLNAADIAKEKGDYLLEANLLEKAGLFREASLVILWCVFANSILHVGSKPEPLEFKQRDRLLTEAKSIAVKCSHDFFEFVSKETDILAEGGNEDIHIKGLKFLELWKVNVPKGLEWVKRHYEIEIVEQNMLERGAHHYHDLKNTTAVMHYVKRFHSNDLMRSFLRKWNRLDELLLLEEEWGNYLEASKIAKQMGDLFCEADLLEKGAFFDRACLIYLWCFFLMSIPSVKRETMRSEQLIEKEEILTKAMKNAQKHSVQIFEFVCMEVDILSSGINHEELLKVGLQFINCWKKNKSADVISTHEIDETEQDLLWNSALHYHKKNDHVTKMSYVEAFHSINSIRTFLKGLNCLDELLLLEEKWENYLEAADIVEQKGDLRRKANLLEKAGHFKEACTLILCYVLSRSLWLPENNGWPLKHFMVEEMELLTRARSLAKKDSDVLYDSVCTESTILSKRDFNVSEMKQYLDHSLRSGSLRVEILSAWIILDDHLCSDTSIYEWNNNYVDNLQSYSDELISQKKISVETLVYYWKFWKTRIASLIDYVSSNGRQKFMGYKRYEKFCLNYLGVRKQYRDGHSCYLLLNPDATWVQNFDPNYIRKNGNPVVAHPFFRAAHNYWSSELLTVGLRVLMTLEALYKYTVENSFSVFEQSTCIVNMVEIAKFFQECKLGCRHSRMSLPRYIKLSEDHLFRTVFPLGWQKSPTRNMYSLRRSQAFMNFIDEIISENIGTKDWLSYGKMGRVTVMLLGSGKPSWFYKEIGNYVGWKPQWRSFINELVGNSGSHFVSGSAYRNTNKVSKELSVVCEFRKAVEDTCSLNRRAEKDCITPACFLYLLERLLILVSCFRGYFFTTKISFSECLVFRDLSINVKASFANNREQSQELENIYSFMADVVQSLLLNEEATMKWLKISSYNLAEDHQQLTLRLFVLLCLVCMNSGEHFSLLFKLLKRNGIRSQLPHAFSDALQSTKKFYFVDQLSLALRRVGNPLVVVNLQDSPMQRSRSDAIFVNLKVNCETDDILGKLFPFEAEGSNLGREEMPIKLNTCGIFWKVVDILRPLKNFDGQKLLKFLSVVPMIKVEVEKTFDLLSDSLSSELEEDQGQINVSNSMLDDLKHLSNALDTRNGQKFSDKISTVGELSEKLSLRRPMLEPLLDRLLAKHV